MLPGKIFCGINVHYVDTDSCARIYRPCFRENKLKTLVFHYWKRAFLACFHENWAYKFGHWKYRRSLTMSYKGYRGPNFLAVVWFGSTLTPSPVSMLDRRNTGRLRKSDKLQKEEWGGRGAESYDRKTVWSSIKHLILSSNKSAAAVPASLYRQSVLHACHRLKRKTKRRNRESAIIGVLANKKTRGWSHSQRFEKRVLFP